MHGICTYIPETNHVPREHCVAAILVLLFMVRISLVPALTALYLYVSTFRSMCIIIIIITVQLLFSFFFSFVVCICTLFVFCVLVLAMQYTVRC
jgi:hypothetical protein